MPNIITYAESIYWNEQGRIVIGSFVPNPGNFIAVQDQS